MSQYKKTLPVTVSDSKMTVKHHLASINHNLTHGNDHFKANLDRLDGLSKVDPAQASSQAQMIQSKVMNTANKFNQYTGGSMADTENAADAKKPGDKKEDKLKKTGSTNGKPNTTGGGGRFQQLVNQGKSPALAAYIGQKKYGKKTFQSMAAKGK